MKKQSIINLVKYHFAKDDYSFRNEVAEIAREFEENGEFELSEYLMDLISTTDYYVPQNNYRALKFLKKKTFVNKPLLLPDCIKEDVLGIVRSVNGAIPISKVLLYGAPGTGKTESTYQIARLLDRDVLSVDMEELIDSHLGQTAKNIIYLFDEISRLSNQKVVILFDELDSLVLNRMNSNDLREMGRVASTFIKELDELSSDVLLIATTNLENAFDKAILRRFDAQISFDRYSDEDLIEISKAILNVFIKKQYSSKADSRLFEKILRGLDTIPYPGEMTQLIKIAVAFADDSSEYDYLRRFYLAVHDNKVPSLNELREKGFTMREIETITSIPKSSVSMKMRALQ